MDGWGQLHDVSINVFLLVGLGQTEMNLRYKSFSAIHQLIKIQCRCLGLVLGHDKLVTIY